MAQLLVREIDTETIERLKESAKRHSRSLQGELKLIIEAAVSMPMSVDDARMAARKIREGFGRKTFSDSARLIREDRDR